jgi:hypothetical protein
MLKKLTTVSQQTEAAVVSEMMFVCRRWPWQSLSQWKPHQDAEVVPLAQTSCRIYL